MGNANGKGLMTCILQRENAHFMDKDLIKWLIYLLCMLEKGTASIRPQWLGMNVYI